ncbi:MAG: hypothetical protein E5Y32_02385 [Mesorhizobium sp.]|nr:MAG: hypothetical protein E5Y32_02385 [Mesorhizobium sp.]
MILNGWDTVFVAKTDAINVALARATNQLTQSFSFSANDFQSSGTFGTWSIIPGGSGTLLMLQIEILAGSMQMSPAAPVLDLLGMKALLLVNLRLLPDARRPGPKTLVFDFETVGQTSVTGAVVPHDILEANSLTDIQKAALGVAIASALVAHASDVAFVFASISPTSETDLSWMNPIASRYAYLTPHGMAPALAILSVTTDRDVSALPALVDPTILLGSGDAGLAIAPGLFLQNVVAPALIQALNTSGRLVLGPSGQLTNTTRLLLPKVNRAGESYYPCISSLSVAISDAQINLNMRGSCDMHLGVEMNFQASSVLGVALAPNRDSLTLSQVGTPTFHKDVSIPWYDHLFDVFLALSELILRICVVAISSELGSGISSATSSQSLIKNTSKMVSWGDSGGFKVQSASLANSLCLRGTLS